MHQIDTMVRFYQNEGFALCGTDTLPEDGFEKVVLYSSGGLFKHAALQLEDGTWTSKLGEHEDISHTTAEFLLGGEYECIVHVLKRPRLAT